MVHSSLFLLVEIPEIGRVEIPMGTIGIQTKFLFLILIETILL